VPARRDLALLAAYAALLPWLATLRPFWLDEVLQLVVSTQPRLADLMRWVTYNPGAAPLGYLAQRPFVLALGLAPWVARMAPAIFSLLAGLTLAAFARDVKAGSSSVALAAFLVAPLELRYAVEARPYSQALFFTLAALWCLWRLAQAPSWRVAAAYSILAAAALYSQPLSIGVQAGALAAVASSGRLRSIRFGCVALAAACLLFVPWFLHSRDAWRFGVAASQDRLSIGPRTFAILVREISGGGYAASLPLIGAAALGLSRLDSLARRFLVWGLFSAIVCALAADAIYNYFFAVRQVLFALPLLLLPAASIADGRRRFWQAGLLAVFLAASLVKDVRYLRAPGEDWPGAARALLAATDRGACAAVPGPEPKEIYQLFEPTLSGRFCEVSHATGPVVIVENRYTLASSMEENVRALESKRYRRAASSSASGIRLLLFLPQAGS